jgi:hypothetical protein
MKKFLIVVLVIVLAAVVGIGGVYLVKPELITNLFNNSSVKEPDTPAKPDFSNAVVVTDTNVTDTIKYEVSALLSGGKNNSSVFNSIGYSFVIHGAFDKDTLKLSDESKRVIALNQSLESRSLMTAEDAAKMKKTLEAVYGVGYETNEKIASPVGRDYVLGVKPVGDTYISLFGEGLEVGDITSNCPSAKYDSDAKMYLLSYACGGGDGAPLVMYGIRDIKKSGEYLIADVEIATYVGTITYAGYGYKDSYTSSDMISTEPINIGDEGDINKFIVMNGKKFKKYQMIFKEATDSYSFVEMKEA